MARAAAAKPNENSMRRRIGQHPTPLLVGLLLLGLLSRLGPAGEFLAHLEYDVATVFSPFARRAADNFASKAAVVYLDEESHQMLRQPYDAIWDRSLHAKLVRRLTEAGARLVYFDILFRGESSDPGQDAELAEAIAENGSVVLIAQLSQTGSGAGTSESVLLPLPALRKAAAGWGLAAFSADSDGAIRHLPLELPDAPSGPRTAARLARGAKAAEEPRGDLLNYYGKRALPRANEWSFHQVIEDSFPLEAFRDRIVFIGSKQAIGFTGSGKDTFRTPYSRVAAAPWNGVEFHILALENYLSGAGIAQSSLFGEILWIGGAALCLAFVSMIPTHRPRFAYIGALGVAFALFGLQWAAGHATTVPYLSILLVQIPALALVVAVDKPLAYDVFISYAHADLKDRNFFTPLLAALNKEGLRCWSDQHDIHLGEDWRRAVLKGIDQSRGFVLLVSKRTPESEEILTEIRLAKHNELTPFHIYLDKEGQRKLTQEIGASQGFDYSGKEVSEVDFAANAKAIRRKLQVPWLRRALNKAFYKNRSALSSPAGEGAVKVPMTS